MTTYYGLYGQKVQYLASDPTDVQVGQVWYNSTSAVLKVRSVTTTGTWASGGNMNTARGALSGAGTQTAALAVGGYTGAITGITELYDGSVWTTSPASLNTARSYASKNSNGTQTSAIIAGGSPPITNASESWNGSTWTNTPSLNTARYSLAGAGASATSSIVFSGYPPSFTATTATESWNGSSWTTVNSLNSAGQGINGIGTQTAALASGGGPPPNRSSGVASESWNGTSWSNLPGGNLNTGRFAHAGFGIQTLATIFGGESPSITAVTEIWNGTSWTNNPNNYPTNIAVAAGAGTQAAGLGFGGYTPSITANTREFTGPGAGSTKTVTVT